MVAKNSLLRGVSVYLLFYLTTAYLLGSVMSGHIVGKIFGAVDIRQEGSGNVGARNAGRLLGKKAFILTFLGDALKGFLVVFVPVVLYNATTAYILLGLAAAIIGHLKPITLQFRGGKGVSTLIGGLVAFDYKVLLIMAALFLVFYLLLRSFTLAGLFAITGIPISMYITEYSIANCLLMFGIVLIIIFAHKDNVRDFLKRAGDTNGISL